MPTGMDHVADTSREEFVRLSNLYEFPDFVKKASMETTFNPSGLATNAYADPRTKEFPCHTKASTWLSALFFQEKKAEFHPKDQAHIQRRIDEYAEYHRIKVAVDKIAARWHELHKTAAEQLPDSAYGYVWAGDDGQKIRRLPLTNRMEVKVAAEWLLQHRDAINFADRNKIAERILEKQARLGATLGELTEFVEKQAGRGICEPGEVVAAIRQRAGLVKNAQLKEYFEAMALSVETLPRRALMPETLIKLATTLDDCDRANNFVNRYDKGLARPEDLVFKVTFSKVASDVAQHVATTSGKVYEKSAFRKLAAADVKDLFGDEFLARVTTPLGEIDPEKMAEEIATLPRPDAELLDGLFGDNGIAPVLHKSASAGVGFTPDAFEAMAAAYVK